MKWLAFTKSIPSQARRARHGQSLVEFAMVVPLFFLLVFGITDFGRLFYIHETLQHALREAGRFAVTGQNLTVGTNVYSRVESIRAVAQKYAVGLIKDPSKIVISSVIGGVSSNNFAGGPGEVVIVSLNAEVVLITPIVGRYFPNGKYQFTVRTSFKNEPFDVSETN